jgi:hypothetical protein
MKAPVGSEIRGRIRTYGTHIFGAAKHRVKVIESNFQGQIIKKVAKLWADLSFDEVLSVFEKCVTRLE